MTQSFSTDETFRDWEPSLLLADNPQREPSESENRSGQWHTLITPVLASVVLHALALTAAVFISFHQSRSKESQLTSSSSLQVRFVSAAPQPSTQAEAAPEQEPPARTVVEQVPPPVDDQVTELPSGRQPEYVAPAPIVDSGPTVEAAPATDPSEDAPRLVAPMSPDILNSIRSVATSTNPASGYRPACDTRQQRNDLIDCGSNNDEAYDYASVEQNPVTLFFALPVATDASPATRDRSETANRVRANIDMVESFLTSNRTKRAVLGQP